LHDHTRGKPIIYRVVLYNKKEAAEHYQGVALAFL